MNRVPIATFVQRELYPWIVCRLLRSTPVLAEVDASSLTMVNYFGQVGPLGATRLAGVCADPHLLSHRLPNRNNSVRSFDCESLVVVSGCELQA